MKSMRYFAGRLCCLALAVCMVVGGLVSCGGAGSEIPDGYQYATCNGEYFRLFLPTQWTVNTESGVSGGFTSVFGEVAVSMVEVPFRLPDASQEVPAETMSETMSETTSEMTPESTSESAPETVPDTTPADTTTRVATLADFFDAHVAEISRMTGYTHEKTSDTTMNASDGGKRAAAKDITYTISLGGVTYRYRQVLCKVEGRFYLFTCSYKNDYYKAMPEDQQLQLLGIIEEIVGNIVFHAIPFDGGEHNKSIPDVESPEGMKLASNNDVPYRFFVPEHWVLVPDSAASQVYFSDEDRSNVSVIGFVPDEEGVGVADYWEKTKLSYESTLPDFKLVSETSEGETMGGRNATVYEYTYTLGGVHYRARQTVCVFSYMIVSMTYTALPENYDAHLADVEAMQAALTFRAPVIG